MVISSSRAVSLTGGIYLLQDRIGEVEFTVLEKLMNCGAEKQNVNVGMEDREQ